jgi:hypothetical protein
MELVFNFQKIAKNIELTDIDKMMSINQLRPFLSAELHRKGLLEFEESKNLKFTNYDYQVSEYLVFDETETEKLEKLQNIADFLYELDLTKYVVKDGFMIYA